MTATSKRNKRLNRSDWLGLAMETLSRKGGARLTIDNLCREIGVTKGSFYAHFKNRADFVRQLMAYWAQHFTQKAIIAIDELEDTPAETRLLALMRILHRERLARHDVALRAWAAQELTVARGVKKVDRQRFEYVRRIFYDMGFRGAELDLRTRVFVVYQSSAEGMRLPASTLEADREIRLRHAFFTRP